MITANQAVGEKPLVSARFPCVHVYWAQQKPVLDFTPSRSGVAAKLLMAGNI